MTPQDVGDIFLRDYLIAMYVATLGVVQVGASYGGIRGMFFLPNPRATRMLGAMLIVVAFAYFITVPLWVDGPWGAEVSAGGVPGRDGLSVEWGTASWSDLGGARNLNDVDGGLSGGSQGIWFPLAAGLALISTYLISSVTNRGMKNVDTESIHDGVELLKEASWAASIKPSISVWRTSWRQVVRAEFHDTRDWAGMRSIVNWWRSR